ncbi:MAG: protein phosphatase 2C domain-containing protein [Pseudomonadota bacterium]
MKLIPGNAQWIGTRQEQQDAFGFYGYGQDDFRRHGGILMVLADGMGGLSRGREASLLAVERMMAAYGEKHPDEPIPDALLRALTAANQTVYELACATDGEGRVGTTLVAAAVHEEGDLYWVAAGDSRLYLLRAKDGTLTQCTQDHNLGSELLLQVAAGELDREQALTHPDQDALTSFIGMAEIPKVDRNLRPLTLEPGDRLMLCSDGVHGRLSEMELPKLLAGEDPQSVAETVIEAIKEKATDNQDNATLVLIGCQDHVASGHTEVIAKKLVVAGGSWCWRLLWR